ncbi:MAG: hypothetical protein GXN92_03185 [Candidatus Micrarchaeota archaeon]|nr:hypothetical protein [Candidatus Micrarchaeota archaeon]
MKQVVFVGGRKEASLDGIRLVAEELGAKDLLVYYSPQSKQVWEEIKKEIPYKYKAEELDFTTFHALLPVLAQVKGKKVVMNVTGLPKDVFAFLFFFLVYKLMKNKERKKNTRDWYIKIAMVQYKNKLVLFPIRTMLNILEKNAKSLHAFKRYVFNIPPEGITQAKLAQKIGRQPNTISGWIRRAEEIGLVYRKKKRIFTTPFAKELLTFLEEVKTSKLP